MSKKSLSEADICTKFITPAILNTGWDLKNQIRQEVYFTNGQNHHKRRQNRERRQEKS